VIWFATQPTDEDAFERSSVEPICFRTAMLARYGYARWMNDVGFEAIERCRTAALGGHVALRGNLATPYQSV
jgi:hypothetical protein